MAHLLGTSEEIPRWDSALQRGEEGRRFAGAGANDDVLSPRLQPKTGASLMGAFVHEYLQIQYLLLLIVSADKVMI
jgi:hypothetical protein